MLPPIFSLRHLADLTGNDYVKLRSIVRRDDPEPYKLFRLRKKPSFDGDHRFRVIAIPQPSLMKTQRWIAQQILAHTRPHAAAVAYVKHGRLKDAAAVHCQSKWLIKLDITNFFESIDERSVYEVFKDLGYQRLVAFEMARICSRLGKYTPARSGPRWHSSSTQWQKIKAYQVDRPAAAWPTVGHLPQGAPTSPMLANLATRELDAELDHLASKHGLRFTRYADDITFSTRGRIMSSGAGQIVREVYTILNGHGFSPNRTKTKISAPGTRKVVLGLLVDGPEPCLTREFRANMRRHLYYLLREDVGPVNHAKARGFISTIGLRNHLLGLIGFARQIDEAYGIRCREEFDLVNWPI
ncbi:MAG: reverse transcriptase family protein [Gluconobacter albidus]